MTDTQTLTTNKSAFEQFRENFSILQFVLVTALAISGAWTAQMLTQSSQSAAIQKNAEKIERLEKETVSRELFDERTKTIIEEQKKQSDKLDKLLMK